MTDTPSASNKASKLEPDPAQSLAKKPVRKPNDQAKTGVIQKVKGSIKKILMPTGENFKESLDELIEEHEAEGETFNPEEKIMLHNVLSFGDLTVGEIMTPRADIIAIDSEVTFDRLKEFVVDKLHTRIPVFKKSLDDIVGLIHIKDLIPYLAQNMPFSVESIMRKILVIPTSMHIIELLARMRASRMHMAIVVDEYGGTTGLITMEDLMEEIVGEIKDEHDDAETEFHFQNIGNLGFEINARTPVDTLEEKLGMKIVGEKEREDFDTVSGLIFFMLGKVPSKGEIIKHKTGITFEILDADARRIKRILVRKTSPAIGKAPKAK